MLDTHSHICDAAFRTDRAVVLANSRKAGISGVISVSESLADVKLNLKLKAVHPEIFPAAGLAPTNLDPEEADKIIQLIQKNPGQFIAIGEVGLDHWIVKEEAQREIQQAIFEKFIDVAIELNLPLNIHSRSAGRKAIELLLEKDAQLVQMHAFDGKASTAMPAVEAGFFFSIPPSIVRSKQKQKLVEKLPLSALLLESDSPVLGPDPDKRNEPANLLIALEAIAQIKDLSSDQVREEIHVNSQRLYGRWKSHM